MYKDAKRIALLLMRQTCTRTSLVIDTCVKIQVIYNIETECPWMVEIHIMINSIKNQQSHGLCESRS